MEEYEPHIAAGGVVYAGVDYEAILRQAEEEADVIIWDGGNNDTSFVRSQRFLEVTVLDALRPGHETEFYPGMVNLLRADVLLVNKVDAASSEAVAQLRATCKQYNPGATVILAESDLQLDHPELVAGKTVLAVEDGPSTTHGGLTTGAATVAATRHGAADIIDPRPYVTGLPTLEATFHTYPSIGPLLPAMGYSERQIRDLEAAIEKVPCDVVVVGTPIDLGRVVKIDKPAVRVRYELSEAAKAELDAVIEAKLLVWEHGILH